jgi:hypothetical protein
MQALPTARRGTMGEVPPNNGLQLTNPRCARDSQLKPGTLGIVGERPLTESGEATTVASRRDNVLREHADRDDEAEDRHHTHLAQPGFGSSLPSSVGALADLLH